MSSPFTNFLAGTPANNGVQRTYKSYAHATNFYIQGNRMPLLPKLGFLYFVTFNLNPYISQKIPDKRKSDLGYLAKKVDLPKFKVSTQTLNQYNRKTNIQTKLTYDPINIEFHDDNSETTSLLWRTYYEYYFADGRQQGEISQDFTGDTKYQEGRNYGLTPSSPSAGWQQDPFFESIDIFVMHQGSFSQYTITNPIITSWDHDALDQANGQKLLQNKMGIAYDSVIYSQGVIKQNDKAGQVFSAQWYDKDTNIKDGYAPPHETKIPTVIPSYPTPTPLGLSMSQMDKMAMTQIPVTVPPRPIGAGTFGLSSYRPPSFGLGSVDVWYGYGGLHTRAIVNAGPIRLVLKR